MSLTGDAQARKDRQLLTLIPEEDRPVSYRFQVFLVGTGAKEFAERFVTSDTVEALKPKSAKGGQESAEHLPSAGDDLTFFCPVGQAELARVRLLPIEKFSESLTLPRKAAESSSVAVLFLFWKVGEAPEDQPPADAVQARISDFTSRVAEIKHLAANCQPYAKVVAFDANEEQEERLKKWLMPHSTISVEFLKDDDEDTVMELVERLCKKLAVAAGGANVPTQRSGLPEVSEDKEERQRSTKICCSVM